MIDISKLSKTYEALLRSAHNDGLRNAKLPSRQSSNQDEIQKHRLLKKFESHLFCPILTLDIKARNSQFDANCYYIHITRSKRRRVDWDPYHRWYNGIDKTSGLRLPTSSCLR